MRGVFLLLFCFLFQIINAQHHVVSGTITDKESGEKLIGVSIYDPLHKIGTACNNYGFYSIKLPTDSVLLRFSFIGYKTQFYRLKPNTNIKLDIQLEIYNELNEVLVSAEKQNRIESRTQMSAIEIPIKQIKKPWYRKIFLKSLKSDPKLNIVFRFDFFSMIIMINAPIKVKSVTAMTKEKMRYKTRFSVFSIL